MCYLSDYQRGSSFDNVFFFFFFFSGGGGGGGSKYHYLIVDFIAL